MTTAPTIWLDKVRAVPVVGLQMNPSYEAAANLLDKSRKTITKWQKEFGDGKIGIVQDFTLKIERGDGFEFHVTHDTITGRFVYVTESPRLC